MITNWSFVYSMVQVHTDIFVVFLLLLMTDSRFSIPNQLEIFPTFSAIKICVNLFTNWNINYYTLLTLFPIGNFFHTHSANLLRQLSVSFLSSHRSRSTTQCNLFNFVCEECFLDVFVILV